MLAVGIDIGTTNLVAVAFDTQHRRLAAVASARNTADVTPKEHRAEGWSELDLEQVFETAEALLSRLSETLGQRREEVRTIGVTGQMHGAAFVNAFNCPLRPATTWQDQRARDLIEEMIARAGGEKAFERTGCLPSAGYLGATAYWLARHEALPSSATLCTIPDAVAAWLANAPTHSGYSLAASTGLFDVRSKEWDGEIIGALGLTRLQLAPAIEDGTPLGRLRPEIADRLHLPSDVTVCAAIGDHQASLIGSECVAPECVHVNIGTGAQLSKVVREFLPADPERGIETRPFLGGLYIRSGAALAGGRTFALLITFFRSVFDLLGVTPPDESTMYAAITRAALETQPEGLQAETCFDGTRHDPQRRAKLVGLSAKNFTAAHLARAITEGVADELWSFAEAIGVRAGSDLHGAGNGLRRNAALRAAIAARFGAEPRLPDWEEEAAVGAALLAARHLT